MPSVAFNGTSAVLNNAYGGAPATVLVVFQQTDNQATRGLFGANTSSGGSDGAYYLNAVDGAGYTASCIEVIQGGAYWTAQSQATAGQLQAMCYTNNGSTAKMYRGLTLCQSTAKPAGTPNVIAAPVLIGAQYYSGGVASYHKGYICEIAWYSGALSNADRIAVTNYLSAKWGLAHRRRLHRRVVPAAGVGDRHHGTTADVARRGRAELQDHAVQLPLDLRRQDLPRHGHHL